MKRELSLYMLVCSLILVAAIFQFSVINKGGQEKIGSVNTLASFRQLLVEVDCNIFVIEGEEQNILIEGPGDRLKEIETVNISGCITIRHKTKTFMSSFRKFFAINEDKINVYITVNSLDNFNIMPVKNQLNIKYTSDDRIGLILDKGQTFLIESKETSKCV